MQSTGVLEVEDWVLRLYVVSYVFLFYLGSTLIFIYDVDYVVVAVDVRLSTVHILLTSVNRLDKASGISGKSPASTCDDPDAVILRDFHFHRVL